MNAVQVEQLVFQFKPNVAPFQYEAAGLVVAGWPHGSKVVDVVANELPNPPAVVWVIEAKDYRVITNPPRPSNLAGLPETVAKKVEDTLIGLSAVASGSSDAAASAHAAAALQRERVRVVLHLEPHPTLGAKRHLFPSGYSANVLIKLRQLVKHIDTNPLVLNIDRTPDAPVPWSVS